MTLSVQDIAPPERPALEAAVASRPRLADVDAFRFLAFCSVVLIHTAYLGGDVGRLMSIAARWAVPFFFVSSGFFLTKEPGVVRAIWGVATRLLPLFLFWFVVYALLLRSVPSTPFGLINGGAGFHLWFLPHLGVALSVAILLRRVGSGWLIGVALVLLSIGLAMKPYPAPVLSGLDLDPRNGLFFGTPAVLAGMCLKRMSVRGSALPMLGAFVAVAVLHLFEWRWREAATSARLDFVILTVPMGAIAFATALRLPLRGSLEAASLWLGRYAFGLYAAHLLVLKAIVSLLPGPGLASWAVTTTATIAFTLLIVLAMSRFALTRRFVM